jgi:hypothetical protein
MKLGQFIIQKAKLEERAERQMVIRLRRATIETMKPIFEAARLGTLKSESQAETLIHSEFIERELRWLYVTWGYKMLRWFQRNYEFERKSFNWIDELESNFKLYGANKVKAIINTTKERAKVAIRSALEAANRGASIDVVQNAIKESIESQGGVMSAGRARTIARTEVIGASNQASYIAVTGENLDLEKAWVTGGANVRESHYECEAQGFIGKDERFVNGLFHPADPEGAAEEVINCKCILIWRVKNE